MLEILSNSSKHSDMTPQQIAIFLEQYYTDPPPSFFDTQARLSLSHAARNRYRDTELPKEIRDVTEPVETLRQQEHLGAMFQAVGPSSTSSVEACKKVLKQKREMQLTEAEVADVLVLMATSQNSSDWNGGIFAQTVQNETLDWAQVIKYLDRPDFILRDAEGLAVVLDALLVAHAKAHNFSVADLWGRRWLNGEAQLSVLKAFSSLKVGRFDITKIDNLRKVVSQEDFADAPTSLKALAESLESQKLNSLDAVQALLSLAFDHDRPPEIQQEGLSLLDRAEKLTPELLLCGAFQLPKPWSPNHERLVHDLFNRFFENHTSFQLVFWKLWLLDRNIVVRHFLELFSQNPMTMDRIVEIVAAINRVSEFLEHPVRVFSLEFAGVACGRDLLDLEPWVVDQVRKDGAQFMEDCYRWLKMKAEEEYQCRRESLPRRTCPLQVLPVHIFLEVLRR